MGGRAGYWTSWHVYLLPAWSPVLTGTSPFLLGACAQVPKPVIAFCFVRFTLLAGRVAAHAKQDGETGATSPTARRICPYCRACSTNASALLLPMASALWLLVCSLSVYFGIGLGDVFHSEVMVGRSNLELYVGRPRSLANSFPSMGSNAHNKSAGRNKVLSARGWCRKRL